MSTPADRMDVHAGAVADADAGAGAGATSTGAGPKKGASASCADITCNFCSELIWHDGQPTDRI